MAKSESKGDFKVEYYEGDAEADAQHTGSVNTVLVIHEGRAGETY